MEIFLLTVILILSVANMAAWYAFGKLILKLMPSEQEEEPVNKSNIDPATGMPPTLPYERFNEILNR